jgi:hypothetical protein
MNCPRRLGVSVPQADDERTGASVEKRQIQADPLLAHDFSVPDTLGALPQRTCAERDDGRVQFRGKQLTPANHVTAEPEAAIQRAVREEAAVAGEVKDAKLRPGAGCSTPRTSLPRSADQSASGVFGANHPATCPVLEKALVGGEQRRFDLVRRRHEEAVHRIGQHLAGDTARSHGDGRRHLRDSYRRDVHGLTDPFVGCTRQPQPSAGVERNDLEQRDRRNPNGVTGFSTREKRPRTTADPARVSLEAPDPDVRVEEQHPQRRLTS